MIGTYMKKETEYITKYGIKTMLLMQCGSFYEVYSCKKNNGFMNNRIGEFFKKFVI